MAIEVELVSGGTPFRLTESGELVTAPVAYDLTEFNAMSSANTAYSFYGPKVNFRFIIRLRYQAQYLLMLLIYYWPR